MKVSGALPKYQVEKLSLGPIKYVVRGWPLKSSQMTSDIRRMTRELSSEESELEIEWNKVYKKRRKQSLSTILASSYHQFTHPQAFNFYTFFDSFDRLIQRYSSIQKLFLVIFRQIIDPSHKSLFIIQEDKQVWFCIQPLQLEFLLRSENLWHTHTQHTHTHTHTHTHREKGGLRVRNFLTWRPRENHIGAIMWMIQAVHLDLHSLFRLPIKNHVLPSLLQQMITKNTLYSL